jgi:hypothetical protein
MRKVLILAVTVLVLTTAAIPGGLIHTPRSEAATPSPTPARSPDAGTVRPSAVPASSFPPDPSTLSPCADPPTITADKPPHPPQPGDRFCDARRFAKPPSASGPMSPLLPRSSQPTAPRNPIPRTQAPAPQAGYPPEKIVGVGGSPYIAAYGMYAARAVTSVTASSTDTIYATMHIGDDSGLCAPSPGCWTEIGWQYNSYCGPGYSLYTFNPANSAMPWGCLGYVAPGSTLYLAILSNGLTGGTNWYDYLYANGGWYLVGSTTLATPYATGPGSPNAVIEIYSYGDPYPTVPPTNTSSLELEQCVNGCWSLWNSSFPTGTWDDVPYDLAVYQFWYNWYGCGPLGVGC